MNPQQPSTYPINGFISGRFYVLAFPAPFLAFVTPDTLYGFKGLSNMPNLDYDQKITLKSATHFIT